MNSRISRAAFSLIEMVAVMALSGTVVAVATGMIMISLRSERSFQQQAWEQRSLRALAEQFRADGHRADPEQVEIEDGQRLQLTGNFAEGVTRVEYHWGGQGIVRQAFTAAAAEADTAVKAVQRETYTMPYPGEIVWDWQPESRLLSLQIARQNSDRSAPGVSQHETIDVLVGRLTTPGDPSGPEETQQ